MISSILTKMIYSDTTQFYLLPDTTANQRVRTPVRLLRHITQGYGGINGINPRAQALDSLFRRKQRGIKPLLLVTP